MSVFFGGMPTGPDVKKLNEVFGKPDVGREIGHDEIEAVIGCDARSNRYRIVVVAWRKQLLKDHNIDLDAVRGVGYLVMNSEERVSKGISGVQAGVKQQLKSIKRADRVQTDDPILTRKQDILRRFGAAVSFEANNMARQIEPPKPPKQTPRLTR